MGLTHNQVYSADETVLNYCQQIHRQEINEWIICDKQNNCYQLLKAEEINEKVVELGADLEIDIVAQYNSGDNIDEISSQQDF